MPDRSAEFPDDGIPVCRASELVDGGLGVRFPLFTRAGAATGFVVRFGGTVYGYLNQCAHVGVELDWEPGRFFDRDGRYLLCPAHGAVYVPDSGRCAGGACRGQSLVSIRVAERDGGIYWFPDDRIHATRRDPARPRPVSPPR